MGLRTLLSVAVGALCSTIVASIDHDQIQPIPQPVPVTDSEKAGVKFKPELHILTGCVPYPAVSAAGEITGGLKGTGGTSGCEGPPLGAQIYGRAGWQNDVWAIMYAWYFPKSFDGGMPNDRHDWGSVIVWIDNPALESPTIKAISMSQNNNDYDSTTSVDGGLPLQFSRRLRTFAGAAYIEHSKIPGNTQDLIMWEQLPEVARTALNNADFGYAKNPLNDQNFAERLEFAWPF
ncbi:hypothetical protein PHYBOEH_000705 [Phytophthora boehmeriae]|uniref:Uncharacterized protein n=1 Tax=Phytophthora boehmeriae TaxID=109152 RepID=A0A8T1V9U9_9STRA|nr:hypothetical protein PHYBOEH_000705 [Phytophthora boehmeriae]